MIALVKTPEVFEDFQAKNQLVELACCFTLGFFMFDSYDMICNSPNSGLK